MFPEREGFLNERSSNFWLRKIADIFSDLFPKAFTH